MWRLHLKPVLEENQISIEQPILATKGRLAKSTVLRMYRQPVRHMHLESVQVAFEAMEKLSDKKISLDQFIVEI
ncbi:MAG: hypothetical protein HC933_19830 [Pleurocapsa sp. SU_196_0]|nr:hypothetical protein [Pleurocapsa sp. SU_196_0]